MLLNQILEVKTHACDGVTESGHISSQRFKLVGIAVEWHRDSPDHNLLASEVEIMNSETAVLVLNPNAD